jgi:hypothetical protein
MLGADPDKIGALAIWAISFVLCAGMIVVTWGELLQ